jgi:hypothetical protein
MLIFHPKTFTNYKEGKIEGKMKEQQQKMQAENGDHQRVNPYLNLIAWICAMGSLLTGYTTGT